MSAHFNLALYPLDEEINSLCAKFAQDNFASKASQYVLGNDALAHVTLCQFECDPDPEKLGAIWNKISALRTEPLELSFQHIYLKHGEGMHQGYFWVGLPVNGSEVLSTLQKEVYDALGAFGISGKTQPASYFPHLSLARIPSGESAALKGAPPRKVFAQSHPFVLSLGRSEAVGMYRQCLYRHD